MTVLLINSTLFKFNSFIFRKYVYSSFEENNGILQSHLEKNILQSILNFVRFTFTKSKESLLSESTINLNSITTANPNTKEGKYESLIANSNTKESINDGLITKATSGVNILDYY